MREKILDWGRVLAVVWNKQMNLPLPEKFHKDHKRIRSDREMAAFVVLGGICGLLICLAGCLVEMIFNRFGGALIFALLGWGSWLFHDHGRGDGLIAARLTRWLPAGEIPFRVVIPVFMMIMKFALLMALFFYGGGVLLSLVLGGIFAEEALMIKEAEFSPPVIDVSEESLRKFWVASLILLAVNLPFSAAGSAFSALLFAGWWRYSSENVRKNGCTMDDIRYCGAAAGWLMLLAGMLVI